MRKKNFLPLLITAVATLTSHSLMSKGTNPDQASDSAESILSTFVTSSELVFKGTLVSLEYENSIEGIPHTFATYQIEEIIKGDYDQDYITLRFVGGYFDQSRTKRLRVSNAPDLFEGEESVLMVKGNTESECPLVDCAKGRFTVKNNQVLNAAERVITVGERGTMGTKNKSSKSSKGQPMGSSAFVQKLRGFAGPALKGKATATVKSANIFEPFAGPDFAPAAGPKQQTQPGLRAQKQADNKSDHDRWEESEFRRNGGNPVLSNSYSGNR